MSITLIGQAGVAGGDQTSPQVISYSSTAGNSLIFLGFLYYADATVPGISSLFDSAGNTWHYATSAGQNPPYSTESDASGTNLVFVAWSINAAAISSVTLTMPNNSPWSRILVSEWSGIGSVDTTAAATAQSGTAATATLSLSTPNDLVVGAMEANDASTSFNVPAGWTDFAASGAVNNNAYGFPGVTGSYSPTFDLNQSSDWNVAYAAFRPSVKSNAMLGFFP